MIWNLAELELDSDGDQPAGRRFTGRSLTQELGANLTGLSVYELPAGEACWPYHFELTQEEWLLVIAGEVVLRTPEGERTLRAGDITCFRAGASGAHAVRNDGDEAARFAMPSTRRRFGGGTVYPDSGKFAIGTDGFRHRGLLGDAVDYWEGEK